MRIKSPIDAEFESFKNLFDESLTHTDGLLSQALTHIRQRSGKQMRPMITLLSAKNYGEVSDVTLRSAVALELLHTASLTHDDVVDDSDERRGAPSLNATYNNKVAVLVGDYILSTCLLNVSIAGNQEILRDLSNLGRTLAAGEIPVITPLGRGRDGQIYNINADIAACQIAEAIHARKLVFLSDVPGVMRDPSDEASVIPTIRTDRIPELIREKVLTGGMLPKINSCVHALEAGINKVHMIDGRVRHTLLLEIFTYVLILGIAFVIIYPLIRRIGNAFVSTLLDDRPRKRVLLEETLRSS